VTSFSDPFPRAVEATSEGALPAVRSTASRPGPTPAASADIATAPSPLEVTLGVLDGRWKPLLIWHLFWGARPFCELMRRMPGMTKKRLRRELADMERQGLVRRIEWGLRLVAPTLRVPARPAARAVRPPDTPKAAVLRLLAEGPAKPKQV
jgi:hypothetical protein